MASYTRGWPATPRCRSSVGTPQDGGAGWAPINLNGNRSAPPAATSRRAVGWRELLLLLSIGLFWGLNWPAVRVILFELPPFSLRGLAFTVAAVILFLVARARRERLWPERAEWGPLLVVALLSIFGFNVFVAFGQLNTETSRAAIIAFTMPVWATLLALFVLGERITWERALALALGMAGLALLLGDDLFDVTRSPKGALFTLGGAFSWAAGTVLLKQRTWSLPPLAMAAWMLAISAPPALVAALVMEAPLTLPMPSATTWLVFAYHVLFPMVWCYAAWVVLVAKLPAPVAAIGTLMIPVVGVASAIVLLGEPLTLSILGALALVVGGVALVLLLPARS
ncbi:MAG: DMT family transporter [Geminicoccaceae bacterium]|nr:MAG: DMT family transporter [Geminicoccaceae bacterium]